MKINFVNQLNGNSIKYERIIKKVFKTIEDEHFFNIIFVTKEEIQQINRDYRHIDRVTDVISFALNDNDLSNFHADYELGDVFICIDRAIEQAEEYGHSVAREVGFLAVHGYLHLLGYDHMTEEDEKIMFKKQEEILEKSQLKRGE